MKVQIIYSEGAYKEAKIKLADKNLVVMNKFSGKKLLSEGIVDVNFSSGLLRHQNLKSLKDGNPDKRKELEQIEGWSYRALGCVIEVSRETKIIDVGYCQIEIALRGFRPDLLLGQYIAVDILRLDAQIVDFHKNENLNRAQVLAECLRYCMYELGYDAKNELEQIAILNYDQLPKVRENKARKEIIVKKYSILYWDEPSHLPDGIISYGHTSLRLFVEDFFNRKGLKPGGEIQLQSKLHDCLNSRTVIEACYALDLPNDFPNEEFNGQFARKVQITSWPSIGQKLAKLIFSLIGKA